jgi:hypothetical protein
MNTDMNRHKKRPHPVLRSPACRHAFQRLDEALAENVSGDNHEKIRRMRRALFANLNELRKSGRIMIPESPTNSGRSLVFGHLSDGKTNPNR